MSPIEVVDIVKAGLFAFLLATGPAMAAALGVGFVVALLQALTQLQDQTIAIVPKILATFATLFLSASFMGEALSAYMARVAALIARG